MDKKKIIKDFIIYICDLVEFNIRVKNHNKLLYEFRNDEIAHLIADKGIEKRIKKRLLKKFYLHTEVTYEMKPSCNQYLDGELSIKIIRRCLNELSFPYIRAWPKD